VRMNLSRARKKVKELFFKRKEKWHRITNT
jgi:hypothetical protein